MDVFRKLEQGIAGLFGSEEEKHSHTHQDELCHELHVEHKDNRFQSFAPQTSGHVKWHVDGCSYFWAVSEALEQAQESIYILDWWLSPELYLRRPPAQNNKYRLDHMLQAAAERGVDVRIIVFKEVEQALTLNSEHTKHHLESLHENIKVFRHPDHSVSGQDISAEFKTAFANLSHGAFSLSKLSKDALKTLYGTSDDVVLFWSHHEKLCVVDRKISFMGGLDACYGRWDTNTHPIADAHPGDVDAIIFPGQDFNNARIYDFEGVDKWEQNKLDRTKYSRMGWSDISISMTGPIVNSTVHHFEDRWNYIFGQKYNTDDLKAKYHKFEEAIRHAPPAEELIDHSEREAGEMFGGLQRHFTRHFGRIWGEEPQERHEDHGAHIQMCRSCTNWSAGKPTEHSIANAYIEAITNAQKFVYIENQFFITATDDEQHPVFNKIGAAIVNRILRAHQNGEAFRVIVAIPAVPAFAGDLKADGALGTRAIMEFQYKSISRGGYSIMEKLSQGGIEDPSRYISFYNLRNYDRLNVSSTMERAEQESGVQYEEARQEFDDAMESGYDGHSRYHETHGRLGSQYQRYQDAAARQDDQTWDTISAAYMAEGPDLNSIPWQGDEQSELDAFVSEELYIHTKCLIADDRLVLIGSANLNDRSQLGTHDSEIAVVIEDPTPVRSQMNGEPWTASKFATSLRRQLFRKHLGLLPDQRWDRPDANFQPVSKCPNEYDWDSHADRLVVDPMSEDFDRLWRDTARTNTEVFSKAFHNVPNNVVRTWDDYDNFFSKYFIIPGSDEEKALKEGDGDEEEKAKLAAKVPYGHIVREEFPGGVQEVKEWLGRVRGTLVEMPLDFLADVKDIAKSGLELNGFTDEIYT
ncbi:regulator of light responsive genes and phosphorylate WC-1 [Cryphonectria parasitica EP155]|uniref:Phospholipase n=1 Tax=Cryphonectria parasitica (strain ATCC 38755 / EP155) TaxID=660469 RepID=A0A9P4Y5E4_CRYP1|nr:regulator of light responsive genes and phosphorylate WC-1 [Cryphonectria parasitica EP155]KAF3766784.1 regulator of light responsive genes and phosphorylate WC-1 [Cryphonectria parasitica EP155]